MVMGRLQGEHNLADRELGIMVWSMEWQIYYKHVRSYISAMCGRDNVDMLMCFGEKWYRT